MNKNYVAEYIRENGIEKLKEELGINYRYSDDGTMIIFSYSQIDSPKTNEVVRMSRGLVLDANTYEIVSYPFYRFYNFEEVPEERVKFNWDHAVATSKEDGSMIEIFLKNEKWHIATRSMIGGNNAINDLGITFNDIFDKAILPLKREEFFAKLNKDYTYICELCSPINQIVTPYENAVLFLIGGRTVVDNEEIPFYDLYNRLDIDIQSVIKMPKIVSLVDENRNFRGFEEMKRMADSVGERDEGFVVVDFTSKIDGSFPRVKVKNSSYVALHHLRGTLENDGINFGELLTIVFKNEVDEVIASLPQFKEIILKVQGQWNQFVSTINSVLSAEEFVKFFNMSVEDRKNPGNKKEFALIVNNKYKEYAAILFLIFNKNLDGFEGYLSEVSKNKNISDILKDLYERYLKE